MKRNLPFITLFFLLMLITLVFTAAHQARTTETSSTPTAWLAPQLTPEIIQPSPTPGWWDRLPTPIPLVSPTPRK
jgi:hypothetical protein